MEEPVLMVSISILALVQKDGQANIVKQVSMLKCFLFEVHHIKISTDCLIPFIDIEDCSADLCQNGGTCLDGINSYFCTCAEGWTGQHCETS